MTLQDILNDLRINNAKTERYYTTDLLDNRMNLMSTTPKGRHRFHRTQQDNTMSFVNEKISEADLKRIDFGKVMHPLHSSPIYTPDEWTIDRNKEIALIDLGGGFGENARSPHFFLLYWQGRIIHVQLSSKFIGNFTTNDLEVTWKLLFHSRLEGVPEQELIATLKDALTCYGYLGNRWRDKVKASHFDFDGQHTIGG